MEKTVKDRKHVFTHSVLCEKQSFLSQTITNIIYVSMWLKNK